jgi:hypothetical protein
LNTKGKTHEKKLKAMLHKQLFTIKTPPVASPGLPEDDGKVNVNEENLKLPAVNPTDTKDDQVAFLRFRQGTSEEDPPRDDAKNPRSRYQGRNLGYDYEYNYFEGDRGQCAFQLSADPCTV